MAACALPPPPHLFQVVVSMDGESDLEAAGLQSPPLVLRRQRALLAVAAAAATLCGTPWAARRASAQPSALASTLHLLLTSDAVAAYERLGRILADAPAAKRVIPPDLTFQNMAHLQCSIDVTQAAAYLGEAVIELDRAISYRGYECPDIAVRGCIVSVSGFTTSLEGCAGAISLLVSSCVATINYPAACANDVIGLVSDFQSVAEAGVAMADDCVFYDPTPDADSVHRILNFTRHQDYPAVLGRRLDRNVSLEESNDLAMCAMDVLQSISLLIRSIQQILGAWVDACKDQKVCAINVFTIVSTVLSLAQYLAALAGDCVPKTNQVAYCISDIFNVMTSATNVVSTAAVVNIDCRAAANATLNPEEHQIEEDTILIRDPN